MSPLTLDGVLRRTAAGHAVRFTREYATDAADLWDALTTPDRLARWLAPASGDFRVGGRVVAHFDDDDAQFTVRSCEPPTALVVEWAHGVARSTSVTVSIEQLTGERCRLVLDHDGLTPGQAPEYAAGWHAHLDVLGAVLDDAPAPSWDDHFTAARPGYAAQLGGDHT